MPIFRYFIFVGGALLVLLFVANFALPQAPVTESMVTSSNDQPPIRIRSDRKLPERVVLDTSQPTVVPPAAVTMAAVVAPQPPDPSAKTRVRETFAQITSTEPKGKVPAQPKRKIARTRMAPYPMMFGRPMMVAQQPHFGFFNTTW